MQTHYNFKINPDREISQLFLDRQIHDFNGALHFIKNLPYKRNTNKNDPSTVFTDGFGTCGTKHALLKQLAIENSADQIKLKARHI